MKEENLILEPRPLLTRSWSGIAASLLIIIGIFTVGYILGNKSGIGGIPILAQKTIAAKFILLVHNDDVPPSDPMQQVKEYSAWLQDIKAKRIADGEHLHSNGWVLSLEKLKGPQITPKTEFPGRQEIGGYFTFEANTSDEALAIARTCPHLNYQGTLELREIYQH
ncbi:MAG: hypothetical protein SH818_15775 [Saprospiraceae bacterium]|nr:hypothetical protein [Saprospiraceae bacterium]